MNLELPRPRNIRRGWTSLPIDLDEATATMRRYGVPEDWGGAIEARRWKVARGARRGQVKRIDARFADGRQASLRFSSGYFALRMGREAAL